MISKRKTSLKWKYKQVLQIIYVLMWTWGIKNRLSSSLQHSFEKEGRGTDWHWVASAGPATEQPQQCVSVGLSSAVKLQCKHIINHHSLVQLKQPGLVEKPQDLVQWGTQACDAISLNSLQLPVWYHRLFWSRDLWQRPSASESTDATI